ncbi:MAG: hypothetical protein IPK26_08580 [Planctomycetes bacterium]|nr:hypothetical protein [Planctomycetota bacterium]
MLFRIARSALVAIGVTCSVVPDLLAQERSDPTVFPADLTLGELRTGAIVEASFRVRWADPRDGGKDAVVEVPPGFRILEAETWQGSDGSMNTTVALQVPTVAAGEVAVEVTVRRGKAIAKLPVTATITPPVPGGSRVLVTDTPFECDSSSDGQIFATWRELVGQARLDVDYRLQREKVRIDATALARVDIVLLGESALLDLPRDSVTLLHGFICGGGRVILCANAFYMGTVARLNEVAAPFGIRMFDHEPAGLGVDEIGTDDLPRHPMLVGVDRLRTSRPSPSECRNGAIALATLPNQTHALVALATTQSGGELITVGESLWWKWVGEAPGNQRLLRNLLTRAPRPR